MADTPIAIIRPLPDRHQAEALGELLSDLVPAITAVEDDPTTGIWKVEAILAEKEDLLAIQIRLAVVEHLWSTRLPKATLGFLADRDWVTHVLASLKPVRAGRFWVHGPHITDRPPPGSTSLLIEATTAFGTGDHPSTWGCLVLFDRMLRRGSGQPPVRVLDMGCGTGVLGIAAAASGSRHVLSIDNDADSVVATRNFARMNHVTAQLDAFLGDGFRAGPVVCARRRGGFELIFANILARPLVAMAPALAATLAPGGTAILAGLLTRQVRAILSAYRLQGLAVVDRLDLAGWTALALRRAADPLPAS